jgi:hypothetical protein
MLEEYVVNAVEEEEKEETWILKILTILMTGTDLSSDTDKRPWMW